MDTAVRAWLLAQLGTATDVTDLQIRYARLGTGRAVALEILRERLAALRSQPAQVNVSSVVAVTFTENIKSYERQIASLEAGDPPAPDDPTTGDTNTVRLGVVQLVARPRR